jgi:uncharacterized membrane protein
VAFFIYLKSQKMSIGLFISPLILIFLGIMLKYSTPNDGWSSQKKRWPYFIIGGVVLAILEVVKYLM